VIRWNIVTGEYPPTPGGVADYTQLVACALADAGDDVHVWAPSAAGACDFADGVRVNRLPDHFGPRGIGELSRGLARRGDARTLLQYAPHAFGLRAMNLPLCLWLWARMRGDLTVMFHEVAYPLQKHQPLKHNALGAVQNAMAAVVARAASKIYVAAGAWQRKLARVVRDAGAITLLPVPSNIPLVTDRAQIIARRARHADRGQMLIGHFGTYGRNLSEPLQAALAPILEDSAARVLLIGRASERFRESLTARFGPLAKQVSATGGLRPEDVSACLSACDAMLQPNPGGVTARNATAIAGLQHGRPVVTTDGVMTEKMWRDSRAVMLLADGGWRAVGTSALALARDRESSRAIGCAALKFYRDVFDLTHTIRSLRNN
jgi:glycosyltransferase involved in cell wall biosynthesis